MSQVTYTWGTERPSQRIERYEKSGLPSVRERVERIRREAEEQIARAMAEEKAMLEEIEVLKVITPDGRIDRDREAAYAHVFIRPEEPVKRGRGRPRKHFRNVTVELSDAGRKAAAAAKPVKAKAPKEARVSVPKEPKAAKPKAEGAGALPRRELFVPVADASLTVDPVMQAAPVATPKAEPVRAPKAKDPKLAKLQDLGLSDVSSVPKELEKAFKHANYPVGYTDGIEEPERISVRALERDDQMLWLKDVGFDGDQAKLDAEIKANLNDFARVLRLSESDINEAMVLEAGRRFLTSAIVNRIGSVAELLPQVSSGKMSLDALKEELSKEDKTALALAGPVFQKVWWHFVDALEWPEGTSRRDVMLADNRGDADEFQVWDPAKEKARKRLIADGLLVPSAPKAPKVPTPEEIRKARTMLSIGSKLSPEQQAAIDYDEARKKAASQASGSGSVH